MSAVRKFRIGDRVVVVEPAGGGNGQFFRPGNTGKVVSVVGNSAFVHFDDQSGVDPRCNRDWCVTATSLRHLREVGRLRAWLARTFRMRVTA